MSRFLRFEYFSKFLYSLCRLGHRRITRASCLRQACALSLTFFCLAGCGRNPFASSEEYVRRGRDLASQGKLEDATIQFRKALQKDPNYGEAYLRFGQLLETQQKSSEAFYYLSRAVERIPASRKAPLEEARAELGRLALSSLLLDPHRPQRLYETAGKMADELIAADPRSFEGLRLKGYLAIVDSKPKDAILYFREALAARPNSPEVTTVLTQTLFSAERDAEAESLARDGLVTFKTYGPLYDTLYGYYMTHGRADEAERLLRSKVANNPKEAFFVVQLADHLAQQKKSGQADELLRAFVANPADYPGAPLDAGDFYRRNGNPDEAVRFYRAGLESARNRKPDRTRDYLQRIAAVCLSQGRKQEAREALDALLKRFPDDVEAIASRADLRLASGKPEEMQQAVSELAAVLKRDPARNDIRASLGRAYRQLGRDDDAQSAFREVLQRDPNDKAALRELADLAIRARKPAEALDYAERLLAVDPENSGARLVRTAAWALQGRTADVRSELRRLTAANPRLAPAWLQTGELDVETGNYAEAERIFRQLDQPGSGDVRALKGLVHLYLAQGQPQKALTAVRLDAARSDNPQVRILLAETAAQAGDLDLALATAGRLASDFPDNPDHLIFAGEIYRRKGDLEQAIASFEKARAKVPGSPAPGEHLADALAQSGRFDEAVAVSRQNLRLRADDAALMNALAWHLTLAGKNLDEAAALAARAIESDPSNGAYRDTAGMISLRSGKLDEALRTFEQLVAKQGGVPAYRTHLATALIQRGDREKARAQLETALRSRPSPNEAEEIRKLLKSAS